MSRRRTRKQAAKLTGCGGVIFGGIFMLIGAGVFVGLTILPLMRWQAAQSWPEVPCRVMDSKVSESHGESTTYGIHISYEYFLDGAPYTSHQYDFFDMYSSGYDAKAAVVAQYPPGSEAVCYVNPDDPADAVLYRGWSYTYLVGCFGLIFFFVGLAVILSMRGAAKRIETLESARAAARTQATVPPAFAEQIAGGPRTLESTISPRQTFYSALIFTIVLYAIVGGVGYGFMSDGFDYDDLIAYFVLGIFALVGLLGVAGTVKGFLGMWNPRVRLEMDPGTLRLGATAVFRWQLEGDVSRLATLRIFLQGRELATYRRGTNTSTDRVVFDKITIAEATTTADMRAGRVEFAMPEFTMHSLDLPNNKIEWAIRVEGCIPKWPDIEEEFPVTVLPLPLPGPHPMPDAQTETSHA